MALLAKRASGNTPFRWGGTKECAFRDTIKLVEEFCDRHCVALKYGKDKSPIYLITDASLTGASRLVNQGKEWQMAQVAAFWSAKFTMAQQNYSVTDQEALAVVCSLDKFGLLLRRVKFTILSNHIALEYLQTQKDLNPQQVQMAEKLSQFNCMIKYIEGSKNVLADALLWMYSEDKKGTERAESKFVPDYKEEDGIWDARA
ncbi:hypothetical protein RHS03_07814, partial [Rhizoctonia solani]